MNKATTEPLSPPPNPFAMLARSRKFWVAIGNTFVTLMLYFSGLYWPAHAEEVKFVIAALQLPFGILILTITAEDVMKTYAESKE